MTQRGSAAATGVRIQRPSRGTAAVKRVFDVACSLLGLILLSPLFLLAALAVGLTSPGGVLFRQERMGKDEVPFRILKFRTMYVNHGGLRITTSNDSRITPVGKFLRKSKLDELPQLLNVLRGDMSLVGPRPEVPEYTALYTEEQRRIFLVRPGITDPASILFRNENDLLTDSDDPNRLYTEEILPRKVELGLEYINNMSLMYDIKLIFQTLLAVVRE